jgi:transposase-like protein
MTEGINLIDFYKKFPDEKACRDYLQNVRWGDNATCPKCGVVGGKIYELKDTRLLMCAVCRQPFSVRVGTVFEDSAIPLQSWFLAIYLATSFKKGISSIQLAKYLGITQKSAWHMLHRIRHSINTTVDDKPLDGIVEIDETYIGGKRPGIRGSKLDKAIYMGVSPKHLSKYCDEFVYKYNTRNLTDGQRFDTWFQSSNGKQLTYKTLIHKA